MKGDGERVKKDGCRFLCGPMELRQEHYGHKTRLSELMWGTVVAYWRGNAPVAAPDDGDGSDNAE